MRLYWYWPFARVEEIALAEAMARTGVELTVDVIDRPGAPPTIDENGLTIRRQLPEVGAHRTWSPRWAADRATVYTRRAMRRRTALQRGRFDVAHVLFLNPMSDGLDPSLRKRPLPLVASIHDVVPHHRRLPTPIERRLLSRQYGFAERYVVHDDWLSAELVRRFEVDATRLCTVPLPVYEPTAEIERPGPEEPLEVLCFGTLRANKGIDVLLRAVASLRPRKDILFRVAGRGVRGVEQGVAAAAASLPNLRFENSWISPERKHELYSRASLVVLPYRTFTSQSAVLHDAYAYGLPVLVTDVGALGRSVRRDGTGWVIEPGDAVGLATTIERAADDGVARHERGAAARAVATRQTPTSVARQLRAVYEELL